MAKERLFLCEWIENKYRPASSLKRKATEAPEVSEFALKILRAMFKSLSNKIKQAAIRNDDADMMIRTWYADHIEWASTWVHIKEASTSGASSSRPAQLALANWAQEARVEPESKGEGEGKGKGKR